MVQAHEVDWRFPVLGFTPDGQMWGFQDLESLTVCDAHVMKDGDPMGMELVDAGGRSWRVVSMRGTERVKRRGWDLLNFLAPVPWRLEYELEPVPEMTLDEVQRRACKAFESERPEYEAHDEMHLYAAELAKIRSARSVAEIYDLLKPCDLNFC